MQLSANDLLADVYDQLRDKNGELAKIAAEYAEECRRLLGDAPAKYKANRREIKEKIEVLTRQCDILVAQKGQLVMPEVLAKEFAERRDE